MPICRNTAWVVLFPWFKTCGGQSSAPTVAGYLAPANTPSAPVGKELFKESLKQHEKAARKSRLWAFQTQYFSNHRNIFSLFVAIQQLLDTLFRGYQTLP